MAVYWPPQHTFGSQRGQFCPFLAFFLAHFRTVWAEATNLRGHGRPKVLAMDLLWMGRGLRNNGAPSLRSYSPEHLHREAPLQGASWAFWPEQPTPARKTAAYPPISLGTCPTGMVEAWDEGI